MYFNGNQHPGQHTVQLYGGDEKEVAMSASVYSLTLVLYGVTLDFFAGSRNILG